MKVLSPWVLRGANDTEMAPGGPEANMTMLEKIVGRTAQHYCRRN